MSFVYFECYGDHRDLPGLTHSFPTRRSSDRRDWGTTPSASSGQRFLDQTLIADLAYQPTVGSIVTRWAASHCALGVAAYNRQDPREWTRQGYRFWLGPVRPDQPGMREV